MLVTVVTTWFPTSSRPEVGPFVERDVRAIAGTDGVDVRVVHLVPPGALGPGDPLRLHDDAFELLRIPFDPQDPRTYPAARGPLARALRGSDVVHSMAISSLAALRLVSVRSAWVHTEHWSALTSPWSAPRHLRPLVPIAARLLRRPDRVTAVCEFLARPIRAVRGGSPVDVVPCIVDPPPCLVPRPPRAPDVVRLVSTGALVERKDPLVAVRTLAELVRRGIDARLLWLGDGPLRSATEDLARELGVGDRLALRGFVPAAEVAGVLGHECDVFFGPTRADNFFVSAAEAVLAGRPVVLGSTGGQGEYVDERIGSLVDVQDPGAYADAVLDVDARTRHLGSEEIAATIGGAFSSPVVGRGYRAVYGRALASARRGRRP